MQGTFNTIIKPDSQRKDAKLHIVTSIYQISFAFIYVAVNYYDSDYSSRLITIIIHACFNSASTAGAASDICPFQSNSPPFTIIGYLILWHYCGISSGYLCAVTAVAATLAVDFDIAVVSTQTAREATLITQWIIELAIYRLYSNSSCIG